MDWPFWCTAWMIDPHVGGMQVGSFIIFNGKLLSSKKKKKFNGKLKKGNVSLLEWLAARTVTLILNP